MAEVDPIPNRMLLFYHDSLSFHGVQKYSKASTVNRKSIYMDYYIKLSDLSQFKQFLLKTLPRIPVFKKHVVTFVPLSSRKAYKDVWLDYINSAFI